MASAAGDNRLNLSAACADQSVGVILGLNISGDKRNPDFIIQLRKGVFEQSCFARAG
jgi:hypothetical protein